MFKRFRQSKIFSFLIICSLMLCNLGDIRISANDALSYNRPSNYTHINTEPTAIFKGLMSMVDSPSLLLIEDVNPWGVSNHHELLQSIGQLSKISSTTAIQTNFSAYDVVIISNDQYTSTYNNYNSFKQKLEEYVNNGGIVLFGASDRGWNGGTLNYDLPGGLKTIAAFNNNNTISDPTHPIVTASYSDSSSLKNADLYGSYCSHTSFAENTIPSGGTTVLRDSKGNPTLVEYSLGNGKILASGLTWEHNLVYTRSFSPKVLDDLFMHSVFSATKDFVFSVSPATGMPGDIVDMTVSVGNNPGFAGFSFNMDFDSNYIEPIAIVASGSALSYAMLSDSEINSIIYSNLLENASVATPSSVTAVWSNNSNVDVSGDLFTVRLKIKSNAYTGKYPVVLTGMVVNDQFEELEFNTRQGILSVVAGMDVLYGDIYTDELVNIKDVVKFSKYFANEVRLNTYETFAADVHKNDIIDIRDAIKLSQYVAGYDNIVLGILD